MPKKKASIKNTMGYDFPEEMKIMPSISLTSEDLPQIKNWQVGGKYKLQLEVEQTEMSKSEYRKDSPFSARFKVLKVKDMTDSEDDKRGKMGYE